jgi:hypothetical protein
MISQKFAQVLGCVYKMAAYIIKPKDLEFCIKDHRVPSFHHILIFALRQ